MGVLNICCRITFMGMWVQSDKLWTKGELANYIQLNYYCWFLHIISPKTIPYYLLAVFPFENIVSSFLKPYLMTDIFQNNLLSMNSTLKKVGLQYFWNWNKICLAFCSLILDLYCPTVQDNNKSALSDKPRKIFLFVLHQKIPVSYCSLSWACSNNSDHYYCGAK